MVDELANDSFDWQETFINAWEKVTTNGYEDLTESQDPQANLKIWNGKNTRYGCLGMGNKDFAFLPPKLPFF